LAKTVRQTFDQLSYVVKANHSYNVPEIIALPIQHGSEEYLSWIRDMTKAGKATN
jgi:periplasmic divalent cation tolerance protein